MSELKNFKCHVEKNILWLGFDKNNASTNIINDEVLDELNALIHDFSNQDNLKAVVIHSLKPKGFIAGADVMQFSKFETPDRVVQFLQKGQTVFARLEALKIPTIAMIDGFCLGGGLELALACTYRIATDTLETKIGLPEVMLGIHPGWGGTVRLPRLIGGYHALTEVILPGRFLSASQAKKLGIIDEAVPIRQLKRAVQYYIDNRPKPHQPTLFQRVTNLTYVRRFIGKRIENQLSKRVNKHHYPAPFSALNLWVNEGAIGEKAYHREIDSIEKLITESSTANNLIRVFKLKERLKSFAKADKLTIRQIHVIGAGTMGGDIAAWCALKGFKVTLQDKSEAQIAPAMGRAYRLYQKRLKKPRLIQAAMDRIIPDPHGQGIKRADIIIEAIFENLEVKQTLLKRIEKEASKQAIIASNTSSIPLDEMSVVMKDPSRLIGIHFFNPVASMELVEVVSSTKTNPEISMSACTFVNAIGKLPLPVKSSPGFLINRVLMPYLLECIELLQEGFKPEAIDLSATNFGMMMGPVELADTVGLDVCLAVAKNLTAHFGGTVPTPLIEKVAAGMLGKKTLGGFYQYNKGKPIKQKVVLTQHEKDIADRLILRMINEAAACLREGVVADADLLDAGMIFATGFAPFRGGPMHYAEYFGKDKLNELFTKLEIEYGDRFRVHVGF